MVQSIVAVVGLPKTVNYVGHMPTTPDTVLTKFRQRGSVPPRLTALHPLTNWVYERVEWGEVRGYNVSRRHTREQLPRAHLSTLERGTHGPSLGYMYMHIAIYENTGYKQACRH